MEIQPLPALRPLRLGELLDQAIRIYRRNFLTFIGIIALVYVPLTVLQTASTALMTSSLGSLRNSTSPEDIFSNYGYWVGILSTIMIGFLQFIFVQGIATGALTRAVADNYLGKPTTILDAYRGIGKSWLPLIGGLLFIGILSVGVALWTIIPCIGWFTGPGMLAFLAAAVGPMVAPVVVLEGQGAFNSVFRSWNLVRRRFWPVLGYIFVLYMFNLIIVNGPVTIVNVLLTRVLPFSFNDPTIMIVVTAVIQGIISIIFILLYYPLQMTAFTLIYFDLRVRTEGFDLALLTTNDANRTLASVPQQSNERLVSGADLGNFAILTLAVGGIYIFLFSFIFGGIFFLGSLFN